MNDAHPALRVKGLSKSFGGFRAVDSVSFTVDRGEIVALIGPNGAGKTTTFDLVNGQLRPDAGTVHLADADVTAMPPRGLWRRGVARTFQITATFPSMTVAENIAVAVMARLGGASVLRRLAPMPALDAPQTHELVQSVGLATLANHPCSTLAYGDLKRVELAMALAAEPRLLLMDEPTAGMAVAEREALMELAVAVARERGAAILFTEHDMGVVFRHAQRVLVMSRGRLVASGTPAEMRESPLVREVYLGHSAARTAR